MTRSLLAAMAISAFTASASPPPVLQRIFDDPTPVAEFGEFDYFGTSVAISTNRLLIGAPGDDSNGDSTGQAHMFDANSGMLLRTFNNPAPSITRSFGRSIAADGDRLLVGASGLSTGTAGQVYAFKVSNGELLRTFDDPSFTGGDRFGSAIAADSGLVLVGAPGDSSRGVEIGQAYLFDATSGELLHTFDNPSATEDGQFGSSVALADGRVLIGAYRDQNNDRPSGSAYLFDVGSGELLLTFESPNDGSNSTATDYFGHSVALANGRSLISAPNQVVPRVPFIKGRVHLFDNNSGELLHSFDAPRRFSGFGTAVALAGDRVLIGANGAGNSDQAHLYSVDGELLQTYNDPTVTERDEFGSSVALSEGRVLVGANGDDSRGKEVGQAYWFDTRGRLLRTLDDPTASGSNRFGSSVSVSGNSILVGASRDDSKGYNTGQALLLNADSGELQQIFNDPNPTDSDQFGSSVSMSAGRVLVGAPGHDDSASDALNTGQAHLFDADSGDLLHTWSSPSNADRGAFGSSVSLSDEHALVGEPFGRVGDVAAGRAYLFDANSGELLHTFDDPAARRQDKFGSSVSVSGDHLLIGAPQDNTNGFGVGRAYLYSVASGELVRIFDDPDIIAADAFGSAVVLIGNRALIGAPGPTGTRDVSQAYLFDISSGELIQTFDDPIDNKISFFGAAAAMSQGLVLIGAPGVDAVGNDIGSAHLFDANSGEFLHSLDDPTPTNRDRFGQTAAIDGERIIIGAPLDDTNRLDDGQAYFFTFARELSSELFRHQFEQ